MDVDTFVNRLATICRESVPDRTAVADVIGELEVLIGDWYNTRDDEGGSDG